MHNATGSSLLLEVNDLSRGLPRRGPHGLATGNRALIGGHEARVGQLEFSQVFTEQRSGRKRLERQWKEFAVMLAVQIYHPDLIERPSLQQRSDPGRRETLSWLQLVLARVGEIRKHTRNAIGAFLPQCVGQQQQRRHLGLWRGDAPEYQAMVPGDGALDGRVQFLILVTHDGELTWF